MQALKTQMRAVSGARVTPFSSSFCKAKRFSQLTGASAGCQWTMKRSDKYLVEVVVADDEAPENATKQYNRAVFSLGIMNEMRRRRRMMTKKEARELRVQEKAMRRKLKIEEPSWQDDMGEEEPGPFSDFFTSDGETNDIFDPNNVTFASMDEQIFDSLKGGYQVGGTYSNLRNDFALGGNLSAMPQEGYFQGGYTQMPAQSSSGYITYNNPAAGYSDAGAQ